MRAPVATVASGVRAPVTLVGMYLASIVAANMAAATFGPMASIPCAAALIGLDMAARDSLHERWGLSWRMAALLALGGALSYLLGAERVAVASCAAFLASGVVDALAYSVLKTDRAHRSNLMSAPVDSLVFVGLAFGLEHLGWLAAAQTAAKIFGGWIWARVLTR